MALSQCAALMEDVPHRCARSGLGPLGRKRLQGGTKPPTSRGQRMRRTDTVAIVLDHQQSESTMNSDEELNGGWLKNISMFSSK